MNTIRRRLNSRQIKQANKNYNTFIRKNHNHMKYDKNFRKIVQSGGAYAEGEGGGGSGHMMDISDAFDYSGRNRNAKSISAILEYMGDNQYSQMTHTGRYSIMTLEQFLMKYGKDITLDELVSYMASHICTLSKKHTGREGGAARGAAEARTGRYGKSIDNPEVSDDYIKEKLMDHFNMDHFNNIEESNIEIPLEGHDPNKAKYLIYLVVITDADWDIPRECIDPIIRTFSELGRILAFTILDDKPCYPVRHTFLSINIICSISNFQHQQDSEKYSLVGRYLLFFIFAKAFLEQFTKIILEVTNDIVPIDYGESSDEEEDDDEEDDDEEDEEEEDDDEEDDDEEDEEEEEEEDDEEEDDEEEEEEDDDEEEEEEEDDLAMEIYNREEDPKYELYKYGGMLYKRGRLSTRGLYTKVYTRYGFVENSKLNTDLLCFGVDALPSMEFNIPRSGRTRHNNWVRISDVFLGITNEYNKGQMKKVTAIFDRDKRSLLKMDSGEMDCSE